MSNTRNRAISVGSAFANLPKYPSFRRSHSTVTGLSPKTLRVVVLGVEGVGKTAMTVRFVTKRFIGDYDSSHETIYRHSSLVDDQLVNFEVMDTVSQGEKNLSLEEKCKWGESFIFVYDVTDKYSFDELHRLKFIASYTHSRLRVNFTPCWVLIGNKKDKAERERMVSIEEGKALSRDLGCHIFREISVKESMNQATQVFEDLWRYFFRLSPRSPSSNQRKKFSERIHDRIAILDSSSSCASETLKSLSCSSSNQTANEILVTTITSTLKRQISSGPFSSFNYRNAKQYVSKGERSIPRIPENINEDEEDCTASLPSPSYQRSRRNALVNDVALTKGTPDSCTLPVSIDDDDHEDADNAVKSIRSVVSENVLPYLTPSSRSSSNASLNSLTGSLGTVNNINSKLQEPLRFRSNSDTASLKKKCEKPSEMSKFDFQNQNRHSFTKRQKSCKPKFSSFSNNNGSPRSSSRSGKISINT